MVNLLGIEEKRQSGLVFPTLRHFFIMFCTHFAQYNNLATTLYKFNMNLSDVHYYLCGAGSSILLCADQC